MSHDEGVVEKTVRIAARPETVWRYWTEPERMCAWWGAAAELDPRPGGACVVEMVGGPVMRGEYVELVPNERLRYKDQFEDPNLPGEIHVTVTLRPVSVGTELNIVQEGLPDVIPLEACYLGWQDSLQNLAKLVEPEIDK